MKPALDRMIADGNETAVAEELLPGMIGDDTLSGLAKDGAGHADECLEFWETEHTRPDSCRPAAPRQIWKVLTS